MVNKWLTFGKASLSDDEPKSWSGWNRKRQGPHALSEGGATATRTERSLYHRANGYNFESIKISVPA